MRRCSAHAGRQHQIGTSGDVRSIQGMRKGQRLGVTPLVRLLITYVDMMKDLLAEGREANEDFLYGWVKERVL